MTERIQYKVGVKCTAVCRVVAQVPDRLLHSSLTTLLADATYPRPVDITCQYHVTGSVPSALCCRSDGLELFIGQFPRPGSQQQQFQVTTQDGLVQPLLSTLSAVEMLHDSALYKCTIDIDKA